MKYFLVTLISLGLINSCNSLDLNAVRGDLELIELTKNRTKVKHYSAWVEDSLLQPYLTIMPYQRSPQFQPNPLLKVKSKLN